MATSLHSHTTRDLIRVSVPSPCRLTDQKVRLPFLQKDAVKPKQLISQSVRQSVGLSVGLSVCLSVCHSLSLASR